MKRLYFIITSLFICECFCFSQDFLTNTDYVYGVGVTDSAAVVSLSISIGVQVVSDVEYTIIEQNDSISSSFKKKRGMSYTRFLSDTKSFYENGIYYRFINKKEYVDDILKNVNYYVNKAEEIDTSYVKHNINLILGCYYNAYCALNDELFILFTKKQYESFKESFLLKAKLVYSSGLYGSLFLDEKMNYGYIVCTNFCSKTVEGVRSSLFAFEYNDNGTWMLPTHFSIYQGIKKNYSLPNDNLLFDSCYISTSNNHITYRILYENEFGKINVPDEWYFTELKIYNPTNI